MEVNNFEIFLIDVMFYNAHVKKLVFNVLIKQWKSEYIVALSALTLTALGST